MRKELRLKDLGRWRSGGTPPRERREMWEGSLPWLSAKDINRDELHEPTVFLTEAAAAAHSRVVPAGSVLLIVRGMSLVHGLPVVLADRRVAFNQDLRALEVDRRLDPRFVYYALRGHRHKLDAHIDRAAHGTARVVESIYGERIPLFARGDQVAITDFLDRECERISELLAEVATARAAAVQAHHEQAYTRLLTTDGPLSRLKDLTGPIDTGTWGSDPGEDETDVTCLRVTDFDRPNLNTRPSGAVRSIRDGQLRRLSLRSGDLLLEKSGGGPSTPVGFVVRYCGSSERQGICSNFIGRIRPGPSTDSNYLAHLFAALYHHGVSRPFVKQVTGIQNLDVRAYLSLRVPARDKPTQARLADLEEAQLTRALSLRDEYGRLRDELIEYRDALITEAVTGKLDVSRLSDQQFDESLHAVAEGSPPEVLSA